VVFCFIAWSIGLTARGRARRVVDGWEDWDGPVEDLGGPVEDLRAEAWCTHQGSTARRTWDGPVEDLWRTWLGARGRRSGTCTFS